MQQRRFSFVLRIWQEATSTLRGSLQLVDSDQVYHFRSLDEVAAILHQVTGFDTGEPGHTGQQIDSSQSHLR